MLHLSSTLPRFPRDDNDVIIEPIPLSAFSYKDSLITNLAYTKFETVVSHACKVCKKVSHSVCMYGYE